MEEDKLIIEPFNTPKKAIVKKTSKQIEVLEVWHSVNSYDKFYIDIINKDHKIYKDNELKFLN